MKDRLLQLITKLGISATKFADELNVQRSGISHILSGRNQPSFDFLVKILTRYPEVDAEWIILGKGNMIKSIPNTNSAPDKPNLTVPDKRKDLLTVPEEKHVSTGNIQHVSSNVTNVTSLDRIILLNSDGTFDVFNKANKE